MVSVRPTLKVLKTLNASDKLPPRTAAAYKCAATLSEPEVKIDYLREAVMHAQEEVALVTYIQRRFDNGIFERHRSFKDPVFESRDTARPAWRGAVIHEGGPYAWLVYVAIHDHFHAGVKDAVEGMARSGTLGPSAADLQILELQQAVDAIKDFQRDAVEKALSALKLAVVKDSRERFQVGALGIEVEVETIPFDEWDTDTAHQEMDMVTVRVLNSQKHHDETLDFIRCLIGVLNVPKRMVEPHDGKHYTMHIAISRAALISVLDLPHSALEPEDIQAPIPTFLHYSRKRDLNEAHFTGKAVQAVCGEWWVPVGDEMTHQELPICPDCEKQLPVAQALRDFARD